MSTHNVCFSAEIRKYIRKIVLLGDVSKTRKPVAQCQVTVSRGLQYHLVTRKWSYAINHIYQNILTPNSLPELSYNPKSISIQVYCPILLNK